jgi:hypothetical protein
MATIDEINLLNIADVLKVIWVDIYNNSYLKEWGKITSWWKVNQYGNYINDFSNNRAKGNPFSFVKQYFNFTNAETYKRFKEKFGIYDTEYHWNRSRRTTRNKKSFISYRP